MRLATVLNPESTENLTLAAQCGVTDLVTRYPGPQLADLQRAQAAAAEFGLKLSVIEGYLPIEQIKLGRDDGRELQELSDLVRHMGESDIPVLCYNFMAGTDWVRTQLDVPARGGAKVTAFDVREAEQAYSLEHDGAGQRKRLETQVVSAEALWQNLEEMLTHLVPVAEESGVQLAMHPDDPPLPELLGRGARIMNRVENFERLVQLVPSPANGICFCQGTFAEMGVDIPETIRRLGKWIHYVHFRDVQGTAESFVETFHDNGPTDMVAATQAYEDVGFRGPLRPDHVPQLVGEDDGEPGYTMKGRLFAYGYIRGLMQAAAHRGQAAG